MRGGNGEIVHVIIFPIKRDVVTLYASLWGELTIAVGLDLLSKASNIILNKK